MDRLPKQTSFWLGLLPFCYTAHGPAFFVVERFWRFLVNEIHPLPLVLGTVTNTVWVVMMIVVYAVEGWTYCTVEQHLSECVKETNTVRGLQRNTQSTMRTYIHYVFDVPLAVKDNRMWVVKGCMVVPIGTKRFCRCYGLYYFLRQMGGGGLWVRPLLCLLFFAKPVYCLWIVTLFWRWC